MTIDSGGRMQVSGPVTIETTAALFEKGLESPQNSKLVIDFANLGKVDSAAVSLLLVWLRAAQRSNVTLHFANVPDNLTSLINLYGVAELLAPSMSE